MMQTNMLRHVFQSQTKMDQYLTQINTGKKNRFPSDDPMLAMKGIDFRTQIAKMEQYEKNISDAWTWLEGTDDALDSAAKVMQRIEDLAVIAANGTRTADEREAMAVEVKQLKLQLVDVANTQIRGRFIFNGIDTDKQPLTIDGDGKIQFHYQEENNKQAELEVIKGVYFPVTSQGDRLFNEALFDEIDDFVLGLEDNDEAVINKSIGQLKNGLGQFVNERAELGARMNRWK
jgi:flagellar hook-associated protein 3 FlgL